VSDTRLPNELDFHIVCAAGGDVPVLPLMPGVGQSFELLGTLGVASVHRGCVVCSVVQLFSATQLLKVSSTVSNVNLTFEYESCRSRRGLSYRRVPCHSWTEMGGNGLGAVGRGSGGETIPSSLTIWPDTGTMARPDWKGRCRPVPSSAHRREAGNVNHVGVHVVLRCEILDQLSQEAESSGPFAQSSRERRKP